MVGGKGSDNDDTTWVPILSDGQWDMQFLWSRKGAAESVCRVEWNVGETRGVTPGGVYRFKYRGRHKILNYIGDHEGASQPFTVFKL